MKELTEMNAPKEDKVAAEKISASALRTMKKSREVDAEFRDQTNSWIEATLEDIRQKRKLDKSDPRNMVIHI